MLPNSRRLQIALLEWMASVTYAWIKLGDGRQVYRRIRRDDVARSDMPCPMLIPDHIEVKSMVDGQMYTSKSALRRSYRERGYIEIGNEQQAMPKPKKPDRREIRQSLQKAMSRIGIST